MHTPHSLPQSNEPDILQPEDGDMDENKEEEEEEEEENEEEEERSTGGDGESDITEEREPLLETLGAPNLDGKAGS